MKSEFGLGIFDDEQALDFTLLLARLYKGYNIFAATVRDDLNLLVMTGNLDADL